MQDFLSLSFLLSSVPPPNTELNYPISVELCLKNINQRQTSGSGTSVLNVLIHKHVCIKKGFSFKNSKA